MGEERPVGPSAVGLSDRLREWRADRRIVSGVCACVAVAAAVAWWHAGATGTPADASAGASADASTPRATTFRDAATSTSAATALIVDVVGAVRAPGVVRIATGGRVADAIAAAGGASADADLARLNLAAPVADGARVAVPQVGRPPPPLDASAVSGAPGTDGTTPGGPIDVNTATAEQLDALPGIGPATAAAIVREREEHGPFTSPDDLDRVKGIGPAKLAQLRGLVSV